MRLLDALSRRTKSGLGRFLFNSGVYKRLLRGRAVIVLFHRIDDRYRGDPITCSTTDFERFVAFFKRFFHVITLSELLLLLESGKNLDGKLVITFDDGYLDNAVIAAPILELNGLRGVFFVTTAYLGTSRVPPWDQQRGVKSEWMSWDHARSLHARGHDIGSHTQNHPDLGLVRGTEARDEIAGGAATLAAELGGSSGLFARPFGWHGQMTAENTEAIRQAGLKCDLSAFGGTVRQGDDPFHLKRTPISSWFLSPYQFGFELVTGRVNTTDRTQENRSTT